jgi:uncharacterized protein (TIGR00661 family)
MKILYGIQGTGHGHISRANELLPLLSSDAEIDVLISGHNHQMYLLGYNTIQKHGISLIYNSKGAVSLFQTARNIRPLTFIQDVHNLKLKEYNLVISDYEPVTSWAAITSGTNCIGLSHQSAFLSDKSPRPEKKSILAEQVLKHFAPCSKAIGFHFRRYDKFIEPPIIRSRIQSLSPTTGDTITVYLPAFDYQTLSAIFHQIREVRWEIFSPLCSSEYQHGNVTVRPVGNETFLKSLETCFGVLTSSGFETCSEAMYLGKKLAVIPIANQYEQQCNAAALAEIGVRTINKWGSDIIVQLRNWIRNDSVIHLPEFADAKSITEKLIRFARKKDFHDELQQGDVYDKKKREFSK